MKFSLIDFIKDQLTEVPPVVSADLSGKTIIVTGANVGLGFEAAKHFARMNPGKLIIACRSKEKGEAALDALRSDTGCKTAELRLLNLSDFSSVKEFVKQFEEENDRLDILVENAGLLANSGKPEFTKDGWEESTQVNNLSQSLLALLLLPRLLHTANTYRTIPRLVVVTSELHYFAKFDKNMIDSPRPWREFAHKDFLKSNLGNERYPETKLMNVFFTRELNERLPKGASLVVNCVNPGFCYSNFRKSFQGLKRLLDWLMEISLARTTEAGSRQLVWAALGGNDDAESLKGAYVSLATIRESSNYVIGAEGRKAQTRLWDNLIKELKEIDPRVWDIVTTHLA